MCLEIKFGNIFFNFSLKLSINLSIFDVKQLIIALNSVKINAKFINPIAIAPR